MVKIENIIEVKNLSYNYPDGTKALKEINLKIPKGKKISFLGENGSGKSTLILTLNAVLKPKKGKILYDGKNISYTKSGLLDIRKKVGVVFQDPETMIFSSNVFKEISFGLLNLGYEEEVVREKVEKALKQVNLLEYKEKPVHFLSYGQKKRLTIGAITAMDPSVIIFDEPTSSLDPKHKQEFLQIINKLDDKERTIIFSTHDVDFAYEYSDYIYVLQDGKIALEGSPKEIFLNKDLEKYCLEKPIIVEIYESLIQAETIDINSELPKNKKELLNIIKNKTH